MRAIFKTLIKATWNALDQVFNLVFRLFVAILLLELSMAFQVMQGFSKGMIFIVVMAVMIWVFRPIINELEWQLFHRGVEE